MSQPRTIKDYFKRPAYALPPPSLDISQQPSSPLSDPPSDLPSVFPSSQLFTDPVEPSENSSTQTIRSPSRTVPTYKSDFSTFRPSSSLNASFNSSQRIVKNGKEVVIDTDAESASSEEFEDPEEFLQRFLRRDQSPTAKKAPESREVKRNTALKPPIRKKHEFRNFRAKVGLDEKKYKFSLESLVQRAVDDDEIETNVAKAKALVESQNQTTSTSANGTQNQSGVGNLRDDLLASGVSTDTPDSDMNRLINAVKRTEALEQEKSWLFFNDRSGKNDLPEFPRDSILASSREAFLREAFTRERAFFSGIVDFALSRDALPDEVFIWIFQSVPLEPRDELRYAYYRAVKNTSPRRINLLIGPEDVDQLFISLGALPAAVNANDSVRPQMSYNQEETSCNYGCLLSVLNMLRNIADFLRTETKEHTLHILFRLTLDTAVAQNDIIMASLDAAIGYFLLCLPQEEFIKITRSIGKTLLKTIKDTQFQSNLLSHILPSSREISVFKCRLAMAFLTKDEAALDNVEEEFIPFNRILKYLRTARLDSQLQKARLDSEYDYTEIKAITSLLNIVIDVGRSTLAFPTREAEREFNADVDRLAEHVKRIFSAMEDSGASHLKRTEAKQGLEALRYRIIYSIRTKRQVKSLFGHNSPTKKIPALFSKAKVVEQISGEV